tara:strand:+ start:7459 stop:7995 length:537 start_codon:yes stop_codon:yes gene_type:complete
MAGQRLTDKTALTEQLAKEDILMLVDVSDTTGSAEGTSKQVVNKYIIQTEKVSLTTAELDLATNPQTLISAPAAGYAIQPLQIMFHYIFNSVPTLASNYLYTGFLSGDTTNYYARQRDFCKNAATDQTYFLGGNYNTNPSTGIINATPSAKALYVYTSVDLAGDGAMNIYTTYQLIKL